MSSIPRKIFKKVIKKSKPIIKATMRSGAENIGQRLLTAVSNPNQPFDITLEKLLTALKSGALATGLEVVKGGFDQKVAK
ncbi:hypothetical protein EHS13_29755 [Paenibacillus psychroresistens]|uniref:Uncharacterized protein n=1 Tax=Paenibacillus psychroresistens TaxID=1778678 RepID=A0A6B8RSH0_9BACL|nr:hypothetical protein [Paenibacillus psychroresistens]QGQ98764.1 hypothetical protein EHS13_29755 [Paenibacillus psychroresistens]